MPRQTLNEFARCGKPLARMSIFSSMRMALTPANRRSRRRNASPSSTSNGSRNRFHLPIGCATPPMVHAEYFHDHVRIEKMFFEGNAEPVNGALQVDLDRPGLGLELKRNDVSKYRIV